MTSASSELLLSKDGVFVHETAANGEDDILRGGKIYLWRKNGGIYFEWRECTNEDVLSREVEWTMVPDTVSYVNGGDRVSDCILVKKKQTQQRAPVINFDIRDMKCFRESKKSSSWKHLVFILKGGTTYPALHFHNGGTDLLIDELQKHLTIHRSLHDDYLYLVREHDQQALSKSFDELNLFENDRSGDMISRFIQDPVMATIGGFSKVTNFFRESLIHPEPMPEECPPPPDVIPAEEVDLGGLEMNQLEGTEFTLISTRDLPPRPIITRSAAVNSEFWSKFMDTEGWITDVDAVKEAIFRGGVEPPVRNEVWKFLLGYYKWDSTYKSRSEQRKQKVDDYFRMKLQWKSINDDQQSRFAELRDRKSLIEKDVMRTDRTHSFFEGENNPNLSVLYDILLTHCMYDFDLGYVQGMSDLLAPILVVMENEVDAFWCFAGLIQMMGRNFEKDQQAMKNQLIQLQSLVSFVDPVLANYLESHDSGNMYFCFRWLLITFKREFSFPDIMRLWEVLWTGMPCKNFHLLLCLAIFDSAKTTLIENNFGFNEILKYVNDLSCNINVNEILCTAEAIYCQLRDCRDLPPAIHNILCLSMSTEGSPFQPFLPAQQTEASTTQSSTRSSPERTVDHAANGAKCTVTQSLHYHNHSSGAREPSTPDDDSIEVLSDHMDLVY